MLAEARDVRGFLERAKTARLRLTHCPGAFPLDALILFRYHPPTSPPVGCFAVYSRVAINPSGGGVVMDLTRCTQAGPTSGGTYT